MAGAADVWQLLQTGGGSGSEWWWCFVVVVRGREAGRQGGGRGEAGRGRGRRVVALERFVLQGKDVWQNLNVFLVLFLVDGRVGVFELRGATMFSGKMEQFQMLLRFQVRD